MRYWQPQLRSIRRGEWIQFDGSRRIATIRVVEMSNPPRPLLRAETWTGGEAPGEFIGYFPVDELRLAAECVWSEYQEALPAPVGEERPMTKPDRGGVAWHPILNAEERTPGVWTMVDSTGHAYGLVRIVREAGAIVYVGELRGERLGGRSVRLREAVERVHQAYVALQRPVASPPAEAVPRQRSS